MNTLGEKVIRSPWPCVAQPRRPRPSASSSGVASSARRPQCASATRLDDMPTRLRPQTPRPRRRRARCMRRRGPAPRGGRRRRARGRTRRASRRPATVKTTSRARAIAGKVKVRRGCGWSVVAGRRRRGARARRASASRGTATRCARRARARGARGRSVATSRTSASYAAAASSIVAPALVHRVDRTGPTWSRKHDPRHALVGVGVVDRHPAFVAEEHVDAAPSRRRTSRAARSTARAVSPPESAIERGASLDDERRERLRDVVDDLASSPVHARR